MLLVEPAGAVQPPRDRRVTADASRRADLALPAQLFFRAASDPELRTWERAVCAVVDGLPLHHQHIEAAVAQTQHNGTMLIREEAVAGTTPSAPTDPLGHLFGGNGR